MPTALDSEQARLQRLNRTSETIKALQRSLLENVAPVAQSGSRDIDPAYRGRFEQTQRQLLGVHKSLRPDDFDPEWMSELRGLLLDIFERFASDDLPLDVLDDFLVRAEAIRHLVRDAIDGHVPVDDASVLVRGLQQALPRVHQAELAQLLGISVRQLQRWLKDGGTPSRRAVLVARLVKLLERSWTSEGVVRWLDRSSPELRGEAPRQLLDNLEENLDAEQELLTAVRQGRAQHGS